MKKLTKFNAAEYLTIQQAAEQIGVRDRAVYRMIEQGKAKAERFEIEGERPKMLLAKAEVDKLTPKEKTTAEELQQAQIDFRKLKVIKTVNCLTIAQAAAQMIDFLNQAENSALPPDTLKLIISKTKTDLELLQAIASQQQD